MEQTFCYSCGSPIYIAFINEKRFFFDDVSCTRYHSKIKCEAKQKLFEPVKELTERVSNLETQVRTIKERLGL